MVDRAIEDGCTSLGFEDANFGQNPYFLFRKDISYEEQRLEELKKEKEAIEKKVSELEKVSYQEFTYRQKYGISESDRLSILKEFADKNNFNQEYLVTNRRRILCDEYDDFEENKETVFVTKINRHE